MALFLTYRLDQYSADGDLDTDASHDLIFTLLDTYVRTSGYSAGVATNMMSLDVPKGSGRHVVYISLDDFQRCINALQSTAGIAEGFGRLDLYSVSGSLTAVVVSGSTRDPLVHLINLPARAASEGVTARPAMSLILLKVPVASGGDSQGYLNFYLLPNQVATVSVALQMG